MVEAGNLLSVYRICLDNNCWKIFDAFCFWIQDKNTRRILYKGPCSNKLYPRPSTSGSRKKTVIGAANLREQIISSVWHSKPGHPSNPIISQMLRKSNAPLVADKYRCCVMYVRKASFPNCLSIVTSVSMWVLLKFYTVMYRAHLLVFQLKDLNTN